MTKKETIVRNLGLTFDFVHQLIDNPEQAKQLPDKFVLEFVEKDFSKYEKVSSKRTALKGKRKLTGGKAKFVKVKNTFEVV